MERNDKKRFVITFSLFYFLFINSIFAQQKDTVTCAKIFAVKINPIQLPFGETRLLLEKFITKKSSVELTLGYFFNCAFQRNESLILDITSSPPSIQGYKFGIGYRYYFKPYKKITAYFNPLFFYKYMYYSNFSNAYYLPILLIKADNVTYHIASFQFQFGIIHSWKKISFDYYLGAGVRYKYGVIEEEPARPEIIIPSNRVIESGSLYLSAELGLYVGYTFKKNK